MCTGRGRSGSGCRARTRSGRCTDRRRIQSHTACSCSCSLGRPDTAYDRNRLRLVGPGLALGRAAVEDGRLFPRRVDRLVDCQMDRLRFLAGQLQQRGEHGGIHAAALLQSSEECVEDVSNLRQKRTAPRAAAGSMRIPAPPAGNRAARLPPGKVLPSHTSVPDRSSPGRGRASPRAHARTGAARWPGRGRKVARSRPRCRAARRARARRSARRARPVAAAIAHARRAAHRAVPRGWHAAPHRDNRSASPARAASSTRPEDR